MLTTHYMDEAERLCDRVAIVDHGKVIAARHAGGVDRARSAASTSSNSRSRTVPRSTRNEFASLPARHGGPHSETISLD